MGLAVTAVSCWGAIGVLVGPPGITLTGGQTQQFGAIVVGTANQSVTWSISPQTGAISAAGLYTAPASIVQAAVIKVTATSVADPSIRFAVKLTLLPTINISVTPLTNPTLRAFQSQQFTATVSGAMNTSVTWSLNPPNGAGTISAAGIYTAPASISTPQTVQVIATSVANPGSSMAATVSLQPAITALATFNLSEQFGATWPDQPIEFRYDGGKPPVGTTRMLGPNGTEVPYQWVSSCSDTLAVKGCIVVRSNLPAYANYTWTLQSGVAPTATPTNQVQLTQVGGNYQITNGLTGVRIVTPAGNPSPWNLAPIQGILMSNNVWTGVGASPNLLYSQTQSFNGNVGTPSRTPMFSATSYNVTVIESGPMKVVLQANYTFNRPQYNAGSGVFINSAGLGHYTFTVTLYANSKSVLFDEDTDMDFSYYLPLYAQLHPDTARWRGHDPWNNNGLADPACGYEAAVTVTGATNASPIVVSAAYAVANGQRVQISGVQGNAAANGLYYAMTTGYPAGQFALYSDSGLTQKVAGSGMYAGGGIAKPVYRGQFLYPTPDAYQDLTYSTDRPAAYFCSAGTNNSWGYSKLVINYPSADHSSGWYVEMYQAAAVANAPVVGFFTGRASKQVMSATGPSVPGIYSSNQHWISGTQDAGIQVDAILRGPNAVITTTIHRNWGIWASTQADLLSPSLHQPIADEQNSLTGINLSRIYTYQLVYPDPPGGWNWLYLSPSSASQMISWVQNGTSVCGSVSCYYNLLYNSDTTPTGRAVVTMWQQNNSAAVQNALSSALSLAQSFVQTLAAGDNHFDQQYGYYQLGLDSQPQEQVLNAILMNNNATPTQKAQAKAILALFGCIFWDDDWFAIDNNSGDGGGLSNQIEQYLQYRTQAVAAAPTQPFLSTNLATALTYPSTDFATFISPTGAGAASTHYQSTFTAPLLLNYLNLSKDGSYSMSDPKWTAYASWELSIQTPPEPRFGNVRKGYSNGDGNTEADGRTGLLGTALYSTNPTVAGNLMWAWNQSNSATTLTTDVMGSALALTVDPTIPQIAPQLSSLNVPGYHTAERHGFGTPNETAVWFINGDFYSSGGHRHADDGQVSIYAHSAPLATDFNANLYYPSTEGRFMHDSIVYDSELTHAWSADNAGLGDAPAVMPNATNTEFTGFTNSTSSTAAFTAQDGTVWTRMVRTMAFDLSYPIIYVTDNFSGPSAGTGKTLTWNMMATGAVSTPAGSITPATRFSTGCQTVAGALPSNGTVNNLASGLQQFNFTGASWPKHATGGINWDVFLLPSTATQQFFIGNWGHGCQSGREMNEYRAANGSVFAEVQDQLRVHDTGSFTTMILPYRKTETPTRTVTQQSCGIQVVQGNETTCFNNSAAIYTNGATSVLTSYDSNPQSAFGVSVAGGPQEVVVQTGHIVWTMSGVTAGTRSLTLPGNWSPNVTLSQSGSTFSYAFPGGAQTAPVVVTFTQH